MEWEIVEKYGENSSFWGKFDLISTDKEIKYCGSAQQSP